MSELWLFLLYLLGGVLLLAPSAVLFIAMFKAKDRKDLLKTIVAMVISLGLAIAIMGAWPWWWAGGGFGIVIGFAGLVFIATIITGSIRLYDGNIPYESN